MITRLVILTICLLKAATLPAESMDPTKLRSLISKDQIADKLKEVSAQIEQDYNGKDLVIVMVLKGSICLVADLIREVNLPLDLQTVQCSSYGARGTTRGELTVIGADRLQIHNRDVLVVDDIFDSGHTMVALLKALEEQKPRSLKSCVLLYKQDVPKVTEYRPDYVLFDIPNLFVVGYGLDFKERYRGLSDVCVLEAP
ncbi:MAG: hypoxanthine phosphoribosyltransferase [Parachlamydiales bacterium]|nr:hypoxanthine phosphoribosyltransferase [Parachlamydiales bacterium]